MEKPLSTGPASFHWTIKVPERRVYLKLLCPPAPKLRIAGKPAIRHVDRR